MNKRDIEWLIYLNSISKKLKYNLLVMLIAILIYLFWYSNNIGNYLSFSHLHISLGHIGYMGLLMIPAFFVIEKDFLQKLWIFFSSITLLDLQNMLFLVNDKPLNNHIFFFNSITLTTLMFLFLVIMIYSAAQSISNKNIITKSKDLVIVLISTIIFIIVYHGFNIINRDIPNEERSCYIGILECHHINYGLILLIFVPILYKYIFRLQTKKLKILGYSFIGFIYGTTFDQSYYYMLQNVSDDNYFDAVVTMNSLLIMSISFFTWFYYLKKENNNES